MRFRNVGRALRVAAALSLMFIVMLLLAKIMAGAQEPDQTSPRTYTSAAIKPRPVSPGNDTSQDSDDKTAPLKYSASVKWMARKLDVGVFTAYRISELLNFATIVVVAVVFLRSKLPVWFRHRTQLIRQGLDEARHASAEAQQRLSDIESRMSKLQTEIVGMQSSADLESRAEQQRIRAAAEEDAHKIAAAAEQEIAAAVNLARRDFKAYAAELAVALAATRVQVDAATDEGLVRSFINELGRNGSN